MTIYNDIYLGDPAANDAICKMRKDKFARKTHLQKAEFFARMGDHMIYFLDLFDALDALGDRAPADVLAAAKRIAAAKGWLRPALAAADGGAVAAVAPHAAVAMQRLRAVDTSRGSAADSAARVAVAPEPDVVMVDASTTRTAAPTPSLAADDDCGDDPLDCLLLDSADLYDSSDARGSTNESDWASVEAWLDKRDPKTFDAALEAAQKQAGLLKKARYAPLTQKIPLGTRPGFGWLDPALVAASLSTRDRTVTEADVRGGAARPIRPFARDDRRRRAHERPSSATPRRAGPQSRCAPAFPGR